MQLGAFPVFISAGVLFGLTLSIVIPINNIKVTTRIYGTALAASVILLVAGIAGGIEQLILLIMRLRGYVTVEKIQKYFTRVSTLKTLLKRGAKKNRHHNIHNQ